MNPALIGVILQFAVQYGIPAAQEAIALLKKPDATLADVEALFAKVKTYEQYNIPNLQTPAPTGQNPT